MKDNNMNKWNQPNRIGEAVYFPEASIGTCRNARNCKQVNVDLANGHCVSCWDRGLKTKAEQSQKKKYLKKSRHTPKITRRRSLQIGGNTYMIG